MADRSASSAYAPVSPTSHAGRAMSSATAGYNRHLAQVRRRRINEKRVIENPLAHYYDDELVADVQNFQRTCLPSINLEKLIRAARVAKDIRTYDDVARSEDPDAGFDLPVRLSSEEKRALKRERDVALSERGMFIVILTVSLAAFLQGHVQSSINTASLYREQLGLQNGVAPSQGDALRTISAQTVDDWRLGAANASPFFIAALIGCPLALPINLLVGRRGAMFIAALLILTSSLAAAWCRSWASLFGVRVINGLGMGIEAVSTPILASETAVGYWRGTSILAWQLWVAFGIMIGFVFNLIFAVSHASDDTALGLILGAPCVPALVLMVSLWFCPESPRYYMRRRGPNYDPTKACNILLRLRNTELQALRDLYLVHKSIELEDYSPVDSLDGPSSLNPHGFVYHVREFFTQYKQLFRERRLRNALVSSSTVALAQQLCGINVMAFYSGLLFYRGGSQRIQAMEYSFGFGAVNFLFGLPAIRTIDSLGRRKWLTMTLPVMCLCMLAAALCFLLPQGDVRTGIVAMWLFLFAAAYSPGLGPIPFTLASESFPLSHREAGCAFAVAVNLFFAGVLSIFFPSIIASAGNSATLGIFAGLNLIAFVLVFLLVEETKRRSLEDLDLVFAVPKRAFMRYQLHIYLPWFVRRYLLWRPLDKPSLYVDRIWGNAAAGAATEAEKDGGRNSPSANAATASSPAAANAAEPRAAHLENRDVEEQLPGGPLDREADAESVDSLHA